MRKGISLILVLILLISTTSLFATTKVLIDFNLLKANGDGVDPANSKELSSIPYNEHVADHGLTQHMPTLMDYSTIAGSNFTDEEKAKMRTSLCPDNWDVELNSSADTVENARYSQCIEWDTKFVSVLKGDSTADTDPEGYSILGIRVHFPESPNNAWALVKPPFEIPAYGNKLWDDLGNPLPDEQKDKNGVRYLNGYGVVRNVGIIKRIELAAYGTQYKNSISVLLKDQDSEITEYHMPEYLDFDGWKRITWSNPNYVEDVANRELFIVPLYPQSEPFVKIYGFRLYRQADQRGGDFVTYIKDVVLTYDDATVKRVEPINHEEAWGILADRTADAKKREMSKVGQNQILRYLEQLKMHQEPITETTTTE
ncbi:MAG: flagellar filament outer layer protein FlaA [Spirochaetes bacterium]|nr:flagellar filament outer layer protein FlaA [Spirochaetota bacterium]